MPANHFTGVVAAGQARPRPRREAKRFTLTGICIAQPDNSWARFVLQSRWVRANFANFDRHREIFLPRQGTFFRRQGIYPSGHDVSVNQWFRAIDLRGSISTSEPQTKAAANVMTSSVPRGPESTTIVPRCNVTPPSKCALANTPIRLKR